MQAFLATLRSSFQLRGRITACGEKEQDRIAWANFFNHGVEVDGWDFLE